MQFANRSVSQKKTASNRGSELAPTFTAKRGKNGEIIVEHTGFTNNYEKIQEQYEETKIEHILERARVGDMSGFRSEKPIYADITEIPTDAHTLVNAINEINERAKQPIVEKPAVEQVVTEEVANEDK